MLRTVKRIVHLSGKYRGKLIFSFVAGFLETAMASVAMFAIYIVLCWSVEDALITSKHILWITLALVASVALRFAFKLLEYRSQSGVGYEIVCDKRLALGEKLRHLSMGFYSETDVGDISSVVGNDLTFVEGFAMTFLSKTVGAVTSAVLMMAFLFAMDWRVALTACIGYPVVWVIHMQIQKFYKKHAGLRQEAHAQTSGVMLEYLQGLFVIRAFNMSERQGSRLKSALKNLESVSFDFEIKAMPLAALYLCCFHICTVLILCVSAHLFLGALITLPVALFFVVMVFTFYAPMELIGMISGIVRLMNTCMDRMQALMDAPVMDEAAEDVPVARFDVEFKDVSFSYGDKPVLKHISFHAPANSMTAIVGASGSGKSTMLNLIARFWDVSGGSISIGGVDIREMTCDCVMQYISAVFQKAYLFHDTIFHNIRFGNPMATREEVMDAAKKARCHDFISGLPNGYDTVVGEAGATLSGGERQRISIARALLKNAPIVLLDEVTANIDPENEMLIQQAIGALVKNKTVFIVAHKLATIQNAGQILVLNEQGRICESGTHEKLMAIGGLYSSLWNKSRKICNWSIEG